MPRPSPPETVEGNDQRALQDLLRRIIDKAPGGGTNMYAATAAALHALRPYEPRLADYHAAIIVMSDGKSQGSIQEVQQNPLWQRYPGLYHPFW